MLNFADMPPPGDPNSPFKKMKYPPPKVVYPGHAATFQSAPASPVSLMDCWDVKPEAEPRY